ncbi:Gem-associated protein 8 [Heterocephalus glaber]|uniref:Gem-associated protein 8 n=1 Tax=Heterocephalus glaber TaxID=10181 RepID=G5AUA6_HETGA|nr:Gem-associated protein 8 [Heterocephalus glaber]
MQSSQEKTKLCQKRRRLRQSDEEVEYDLNNREVTDELHQYFAETQRHSEEQWRGQQQVEAKYMNDCVTADHNLSYNCLYYSGAPDQGPLKLHRAEMKHLYEESTAKIQVMEAAVQMS